MMMGFRYWLITKLAGKSSVLINVTVPSDIRVNKNQTVIAYGTVVTNPVSSGIVH